MGKLKDDLANEVRKQTDIRKSLCKDGIGRHVPVSVRSELPEVTEKEVSSEAINNYDDKKIEKSDSSPKRRRRPRKHRPIVKWLGSSISKELDEIKLEGLEV